MKPLYLSYVDLQRCARQHDHRAAALFFSCQYHLLNERAGSIVPTEFFAKSLADF